MRNSDFRVLTKSQQSLPEYEGLFFALATQKKTPSQKKDRSQKKRPPIAKKGPTPCFGRRRPQGGGPTSNSTVRRREFDPDQFTETTGPPVSDPEAPDHCHPGGCHVPFRPGPVGSMAVQGTNRSGSARPLVTTSVALQGALGTGRGWAGVLKRALAHQVAPERWPEVADLQRRSEKPLVPTCKVPCDHQGGIFKAARALWRVERWVPQRARKHIGPALDPTGPGIKGTWRPQGRLSWGAFGSEAGGPVGS